MYDARVGLQDSVSILKGIGPKSVRLLAKLDVHTIDDLLHMFPKRFEDRTQTSPLAACTDGEAAYVTGIAESFSERRVRHDLTRTRSTEAWLKKVGVLRGVNQVLLYVFVKPLSG